MSGEQFTSVDKAAMDAGLDNLDKAAKALDTELDNLRTTLNNRLRNWTGKGREEYDKIQARWDTQATENQNLVISLRKTLDEIIAKYVANENKVAGRWGG